METRIASLEDDPAQAAWIQHVLRNAGLHCVSFEAGRELMLSLREHSFDVLLLDWQLPDMSGKDLLCWVRANVDRRVPAMFLSCRDAEEDIVGGLHAGADDYMVKPIRPAELVARLQALLRRAAAGPRPGNSPIELGGYTLDCAARSAARHGRPLKLTPKEFDLAVLLFRNEGRIVSRDHIVAAVWGREISPLSRTIDTHMSRVRGKLGLHPCNGMQLVPVYTHGYRLELLERGGSDGAEAMAAA
ncbi:DNA-binding response regulator [Cupriavidus sp. USMAHM13]|uniref:response regulator transcription factor n=1 Tax=Cupriavidus sp. USMAHM13 TaxID=1389192 RepID=UPI0008A6B5BD|nr:response regulator transcription factor [Cupriavidus sp. USMAHM13]AOY98338.1 DNA-binding response regulator [Cupriavidus sp. USMAHM13]